MVLSWRNYCAAFPQQDLVYIVVNYGMSSFRQIHLKSQAFQVRQTCKALSISYSNWWIENKLNCLASPASIFECYIKFRRHCLHIALFLVGTLICINLNKHCLCVSLYLDLILDFEADNNAFMTYSQREMSMVLRWEFISREKTQFLK